MNKQLNLKIADISIGIKARKGEYLERLERYYKGFTGNNMKPDLSISICDKPAKKNVPTTKYVSLIKKNNNYTVVNKNQKAYVMGDIYPVEGRSNYYNRYKDFIIPFFDSLLQTCVQISLREKGGVFLHASAVNFDGRGYVFSGPASSGKTTIVKMKKGLDIISEECVTLGKHNGYYYIFETPWCGRQNKCVRLDKIFFLRKYKRLKFQRLNRAGSLSEIISNTPLRICGEDEYEIILNILESIISKIPCYNLYFSLTSKVWSRIPFIV